MRRYEYPYLADWLVISLRWMTLVGMTAILGIFVQPGVGFLVVLAMAIVYNSLMTVITMFNRRLSLHRELNIIFDIAFGALFFATGGGINGPLPWIALYPIFTAAVYSEWLGSFFVGALFTAIQIFTAVIVLHQSNSPEIFILLAAANTLTGILFGMLGKSFVNHFRKYYTDQTNQRKEYERRLQRQMRNRMQVFYQMAEALGSTLNYEIVLDTALDVSANGVGESDEKGHLVRAILLFDERQLSIGASRLLPPPDLRATFPAASGVLHDVIQSGEPKHIQDPFTDPELRKLVSLSNCHSALVLPLRRGLNAFGVALFAHQNSDFFNPQNSELLEMISHQAVIAIQNARLFEDLETEKERIVESQEEARKKLARDLHDGPTQSISAIAMQLNVIRSLLKTDLKTAAEELSQSEDLARKTVKEIRHMLFTLRPLALEDEGLVVALNTMATKMDDVFKQKVRIQVDSQLLGQLELGKQTVIFYLVEEALNNARKHAQASEIIVRLFFHPKAANIAVLEIADNGVGFDVKAVMNSYTQRSSMGMVNLQERSELIDGSLQIDSVIGKGTRVRVLIPLDQEAKDRLQQNELSGS
jgi:signal transduction histidine kinase